MAAMTTFEAPLPSRRTPPPATDITIAPSPSA